MSPIGGPSPKGRKPEIPAAKQNPSTDAPLYVIRVCKRYKVETAISILYPVPRSEVERLVRQNVHQMGAHEFFEDLAYAVVIHGENLSRHSPETLKWICGMGPNPMDSNWMGQGSGGIAPEHLYKKFDMPPYVEGRTARQMMEAPKGAIFVWCNEHLDYPKKLAVYLGIWRGRMGSVNLRIVRPSWLQEPGNLAQCRKDCIILDHACTLTALQQEMFQHWEKNRDR